MITGNISGIKRTVLDRIEKLYELTIDNSMILSRELAEEISNITMIIKREISIVTDRKGKITDISIGNINSAELPYLGAKENKLCGYRVIHSHPSGDSSLSNLDTSALMNLRLDAMVAIGVKENPRELKVSIGLCEVINNSLSYQELKDLCLQEALEFNFRDKLLQVESSMCSLIAENPLEEKAILVGTESQESLSELARLAEACNVTPLEAILQKQSRVNSAYLAGEGKIREISHLRQLTGANVVIFDQELSGSQVRNLEEAIGYKIIDRTTLILDIFARRARSKESILQVELAILNHKLPRLRNSSANLARIKGGVGLKGGVGSRGPGEKKLETDRRHIEKRIEDIKRELRRVVDQRTVQRGSRTNSNVSNVAIVGYTNAGKSTLRNKLCQLASTNRFSKEGVLEADMLFATLDTTIRSISLEDKRQITLSDTVGFIRNLPHELVEAFKSTLEEVTEADLLLHVVDASSKEALEQIKSVNTVLSSLEARNKNTIVLLNKIDRCSLESLREIKDYLQGEKVLEISAVEGTNLQELLRLIGNEIPSKAFLKEFVIPYENQGIIALLHDEGKVLNTDYIEKGVSVKAMVSQELYRKVKSYEAV